MKILLIFPGWTKAFGNFSRIAKKASTFPPLNLALLAAIAERDGHEVQLIDAESENISNNEILEKVRIFSPDLIGFTATTPIFHIVKNLASVIKERFDIPIILGGTHATIFMERCFDACFDFLFIGEAERTFAAFLKAYSGSKDFSSVPGIIIRKDGKSLFTGTPEPISNLDSIPFPARHLLKTGHYKVGTMHGGKIYTSIMFSRGCPFKCIYCSIKVFGNIVRRRSIHNLVTEIETVVSQFNVRHFYFIDDVLTLDRQYILNFCNELEKRKIKITFEGSTRANLVDEELIERLAHSGLIRLSFGLETADPEILKIIRKEVSLESYIKANRLTNKYHIETINSVMLGLPNETYESINKTITFLRRNREIQHSTYSIAMPYPGTEFYEMAKKGQYGLKLHTEDFSKYQRYNSAVLSVNGITPEEFIHFQKLGLLKIYLTPWRILPLVRRFGFQNLISPLCIALKDFIVCRFHNGKQNQRIRAKR